MKSKAALKLAAKAGFYVDDEGKVWPQHPSCDVSEEFDAFVWLIVDECINVSCEAGEIISNHDRMVDPRTFAGSLIYEHFFLEEEEDQEQKDVQQLLDIIGEVSKLDLKGEQLDDWLTTRLRTYVRDRNDRSRTD